MTEKHNILMNNVKVITTDHDKITREQDEFKTILMTKMCLLLNSKKREISRLNSLISNEKNSFADSPKSVIDEKPKAKKRKAESTIVENSESEADSVSVKAPKITRGKATRKVMKGNFLANYKSDIITICSKG
jgi:hypothetical protein